MTSTGGRFERCLRFTLREEGGLSNDPADKGGLTNHGVTQATFEAARAAGALPLRVKTVRDLTLDDAEHVYFVLFWLPSRAFEFPAPLDLCLFDAYVNHRPDVAVRFIQAAVGSTEDGIVGMDTVAKALAAHLAEAVERYAHARETFYHELVKRDSTQARFLRGWLTRVATVKASAMAEVL
jgi:lysozyme family protein